MIGKVSPSGRPVIATNPRVVDQSLRQQDDHHMDSKQATVATILTINRFAIHSTGYHAGRVRIDLDWLAAQALTWWDQKKAPQEIPGDKLTNWKTISFF